MPKLPDDFAALYANDDSPFMDRRCRLALSSLTAGRSLVIEINGWPFRVSAVPGYVAALTWIGQCVSDLDIRVRDHGVRGIPGGWKHHVWIAESGHPEPDGSIVWGIFDFDLRSLQDGIVACLAWEAARRDPDERSSAK